MVNDQEKAGRAADEHKVYWASRRGMLELDLVLMPFAKDVYPSLSQTDQQAYRQLLEEQDQDLFSWFLGRQQPDDPGLKRTVDMVLAQTRAPSA